MKTVEEILALADAYGDARIMVSRGRAERCDVDLAREQLREAIARALGVVVGGPGTIRLVIEAGRVANVEEVREALRLRGPRHPQGRA